MKFVYGGGNSDSVGFRHSPKFSYAELMLELGFDTLSKQSSASYGSARFDYFSLSFSESLPPKKGNDFLVPRSSYTDQNLRRPEKKPPK